MADTTIHVTFETPPTIRVEFPAYVQVPVEEGLGGGDGDDGWSPILAVVSDGTRRVLQVTDWTGGEGTKPSTGSYIGASGLTGTIGLAVDIRGAAGADGSNGTNGTNGTNGSNGTNGLDGNDGWSPILAVVSDGARRVLQVTDWTGGEGTKPSTGSYIGASGLTGTIGSAVDIRGAAGADGAAGAAGPNTVSSSTGTDITGILKGNGSTVSAATSNVDFAAASHASRHQSGGADALKLDDLATPDDNTDLDASTTRHGLLPKLPGGTSTFLRADGVFANPGSSDPFDLSVFVVVEDWANGTAAGTHGWTARTIGSGSTGTAGSGFHDAPGHGEIRTGTTTGAGIRFELTSGTTSVQQSVDGTRSFELQARFRFVTALSGARLRFGFSGSSAAQPTDGVWLRYDVNSSFGDSTFKLACRTGSGSETVQDTGVTPALNTWYKLRIWSTGDSVVRCTVDSSSEVSISSGLPSTGQIISFILCTDASADQRLQVDWLAFRSTGLSR